MNFKPCADEIFSNNNENTSTVVGTDSHQHGEKDDCSPFCYCACSSVRSFSRPEPITLVFLPQITLHKPTFLLGRMHQISLAIWQPPKLA